MLARIGLRTVLAALAILALVALNLWSYRDVGVDQVSGPNRTPQAVPSLEDVEVADEIGRSDTAMRRDLFAFPVKTAASPTLPVAEPAPAPEALDAPEPIRIDQRALKIADAKSRIEAFTVLGLLRASDGMVAVMENNGSVVNVLLGEELIPGFVISEISFEKVTIINERLEHTFDLVLGGN